MNTSMSIIIPVDIYLLKAHYQCGDKLNYSDRCSHLDHTVTPSLHVIAASQLLVMTIMPAPAGTTDQCGDQLHWRPLTSVATRCGHPSSRHPHVAACCCVLTITPVSLGSLLIIFIMYQKHQVNLASHRVSSCSF